MTDKEKQIYYKTYGLEPVSKRFLKKQELHNLFKLPKKDNDLNTPHIQQEEPNVVQQADLLFLPHDGNYKYALVVVDLGSRLTDAEPIKDKTSETVKKAFKEIYRRNILSLPEIIQVDPGSEFKGEVKKYFDKNNVYVRYGKAGRHRQQALVERRNQVLGNALMKKMQAEELLTGQISKRWVDALPRFIKAMNIHYSKQKPKKYPNVPVCSGDSCKILNEGTKVRAILDEPRDLLGNKLIGKFRSGDIRFDPKVRVVKQLLLRPGQPPLYLLDNPKKPDGVDNVPYTKNQLQVISEDEEAPSGEIVLKGRENDPDTTYVVNKILDKKKVKGKWKLLINWKGFPSTYDSWEPYNEIKKDVPELIKEFEEQHKKKKVVEV